MRFIFQFFISLIFYFFRNSQINCFFGMIFSWRTAGYHWKTASLAKKSSRYTFSLRYTLIKFVWAEKSSFNFFPENQTSFIIMVIFFLESFILGKYQTRLYFELNSKFQITLNLILGKLLESLTRKLWHCSGKNSFNRNYS